MGFNGKILKKIREEKGVTQMQLCHAVNLHQSLYSKYERGIVKNVPADKVKKISDYFGVPYEIFFGELKEDEPERIDVHVHVTMGNKIVLTEEEYLRSKGPMPDIIVAYEYMTQKGKKRDWKYGDEMYGGTATPKWWANLPNGHNLKMVREAVYVRVEDA